MQEPNWWNHIIPVWALHIFASDVMLCHVMLEEPQSESQSGVCAPSGGAAFTLGSSRDVGTVWHGSWITFSCFCASLTIFLALSRSWGWPLSSRQCVSWSGGMHLGIAPFSLLSLLIERNLEKNTQLQCSSADGQRLCVHFQVRSCGNVKGHCVVLERKDFYIYNINEVIIQSQKYEHVPITE